MVIISEAMARRCWTDGDAVGRLVRRREDDPPWLAVGMASDAKVRTLGEAPRNMVYLPYSQRFTPLLTVVARTPIDPERTAGVNRVTGVRKVSMAVGSRPKPGSTDCTC